MTDPKQLGEAAADAFNAATARLDTKAFGIRPLSGSGRTPEVGFPGRAARHGYKLRL